MDEREAIKANLKLVAELRKKRGLSQCEFGQMLGIAHTTVSRIESGDYMPSLSTYCAIMEKARKLAMRTWAKDPFYKAWTDTQMDAFNQFAYCMGICDGVKYARSRKEKKVDDILAEANENFPEVANEIREKTGFHTTGFRNERPAKG